MVHAKLHHDRRDAAVIGMRVIGMRQLDREVLCLGCAATRAQLLEARQLQLQKTIF